MSFDPATIDQSKMSDQCRKLFSAMVNGIVLTDKVSMQLCNVYALSQRCGELKRKHGVPVKDKWVKEGRSRFKAFYVEVARRDGNDTAQQSLF